MKFSNRLVKETSPYLLQHAHNPVDWYPWGEEAFEKAKAEQKPIIVSIGYSTCHWCHVMERESFEDEQIAAYMNRHFVNIKVDREERPDIDAVYMEAVQLVTGGHGGWPLNCFLLPDGRPFYGGTYFPPQTLHGRISWIEVLQNIHRAFSQRPNEVEHQAEKLLSYLHQADHGFVAELEGFDQENEYSKSTLDKVYQELSSSFDQERGGFGSAPKFPGTMALRYCLNYWFYAKDHSAMAHLQHSLDAMIYGGIYDQLRGGFSRYTVDRNWLIPHFEKMLYDNALLLGLLADSYKATKKELYKTTIEETLAWLKAEMRSAEGGFYSALDADSEGEEGKFYVWTYEELVEILEAYPSHQQEHFIRYYNVEKGGNWEGKNILHRNQSLKGYAEDHQLDPDSLENELNAMKLSLLKQRETRIRPGLDDKILLSWNALLCTAFTKIYQATGAAEYLDMATDLWRFLNDKMSDEEGLLLHSYKAGTAKQAAFLDDYAFFIEASVQLYQVCFDVAYLDRAKFLTNYVLDAFGDEISGLFYFTDKHQPQLIVRKKDIYDSAIPSANATMLHNLRQLSILLDRSDFMQRQRQMLDALKDSVEKYPQSFGRWANAFFHQVYPNQEIAIVGKAYKEKAKFLQAYYLPSAIFAAAAVSTIKIPLLTGRGEDNQTLFYICKNYSCQLPVETTAAALEQLF